MNPLALAETNQSLQKAYKLLQCIKCSRFPTQDEPLYLSRCPHKHCEFCLRSSNSCSICKRKLDTKHIIRDTLSMTVLAKLRDFENLIKIDPIEEDDETRIINIPEGGDADAIGNGNDNGNGGHHDDINDENDDLRSVSDIFSMTPTKFCNENEKVDPIPEPEPPTVKKYGRSRKKPTHTSTPIVSTEVMRPENVRSSRRLSRSTTKLAALGTPIDHPAGQRNGNVKSTPNETLMEVDSSIRNRPTPTPVVHLETPADSTGSHSPPPKLIRQGNISFVSNWASPDRPDGKDVEIPILTPYGPVGTATAPAETKSKKKEKKVLVPKRRLMKAKADKEEKIDENANEQQPKTDSKLQADEKSKVNTPTFMETPKRGKGKTQRGRSIRKSKISEVSQDILDVTKATAAPSPIVPKLKKGSIKGSSSGASSVVSNQSGDSSASTEKRNANGETRLHVASRLGKVEMVKSLLESGGVDINAKDFAGWTPLHEAINGKTSYNLLVATILCEAGCHVSIPGMGGETPLHEAARLGILPIIDLLLTHGANRTIRNNNGLLPRDLAISPEVAAIIDNFNGPIVRSSAELEPPISTQDDKCIYFTTDCDAELVARFKEEFERVRVSSELSRDVSHIIFEAGPNEPLPLTLDYLMGVLSGAWLLSSKWVGDSLCRKECLDPGAYEICGYEEEAHFSSPNGDSESLLQLGIVNVPKRARTNREQGNPRLFHGINFYLYKNCSYKNLQKKDLAKLITFGDGVVINRDPNPDAVDPLENPTRFHAQKSTHKMILTSHVVLYNPENCPTKLHNMEHVKSLRVDWLIQSILYFRLMDPGVFLN